MLFERHFTLAEAERLLPEVQRVFAEVRALLLEEAGNPMALTRPAPPIVEKRNGHGRGGTRLILPESPPREERVAGVRQALSRITGRGIVIQDIQRGLIDFPYLCPTTGEELLICYELADGDEIIAFHGVHDGFAGRKPIEGLPGSGGGEKKTS